MSAYKIPSCDLCGTQVVLKWNYCPMCGNTLKGSNKNKNCNLNPMVTCIANTGTNGGISSINTVKIALTSNKAANISMMVKKCTYCQGKGINGIGGKCNVC